MKRPAASTSDRAHPDLRFPGEKSKSRVYTDVKNRRWRLYSRDGDAVEKSLHRNNFYSPSVCWHEVVAELRRLNPNIVRGLIGKASACL